MGWLVLVRIATGKAVFGTNGTILTPLKRPHGRRLSTIAMPRPPWERESKAWVLLQLLQDGSPPEVGGSSWVATAG